MGLRFERRCERWCIRPLAPPRARRYCPTCKAASEFVCSERFRVNAQKKTIDVWLNYRCSACDGVWKAPVIERRPVSEISSALLAAFLDGDEATVWKYAFDAARLRPHVIRLETDVPVRVERSCTHCRCADAGGACIYLDVPLPCDLRLDRLLAAELQVSRAQLHCWRNARQLTVSPGHAHALRRRIRDGQRIWMRAGVVSAL
jgi:hypothetical protein